MKQLLLATEPRADLELPERGKMRFRPPVAFE